MDVDPRDVSGHSLEVFTCPSDYAPSRFFARYNKSYVAPIYHINLEEVGESTNLDTIQLWGWTFDQLADQLSLRRDAQEFGSYVSDRREGTIPCAASKVSEVFKSAYLRVLEALASTKMIDGASLRALSAIVCPVDFSFWGIGVRQRPDWWPEAKQNKEGLQPSEEWEKTSELALKVIDESELIFAEGSLSSAKDELQSSRFSVVPFAYRVLGTELPTPEQIFKLLRRSLWSQDGVHSRPLSFFDVPLPEWTPDGQEGIHIDDLLLLPLLARIHSTNINCWQYWRGTSPLAFPAAHLTKGGTCSASSEGWALNVAGRTVFSGFNWTNGPMLRLRFQFGECGQFATCDSAWLKSFLGKQNLKVGFALNHEYRIRKSEYSEYEKSDFTKLINFERLISQ